MNRIAEQISKLADFSFLPHEMAQDLEASLGHAVKEAVLEKARSPLALFRAILFSSLRDIENHPRGQLLQRFLTCGPYEGEGNIPAELASERLSDCETSLVIRFIWSYVINSFKGALAELLAVRPCLHILSHAKREGLVPQGARLYIGQTVTVPRARGTGTENGADMHILAFDRTKSGVSVAGIVEVKSYAATFRRIRPQLKKHILRCRRGLVVCGKRYRSEPVQGSLSAMAKVTVVPSRWKLPRTFRYEETPQGELLNIDTRSPSADEDSIERSGKYDWHVRLRWSEEALAEVAYGMTFWYMAKAGEVIYRDGVPNSWKEMTPSEAGKNAAKMMLYYASLRASSPRESQRAIAMYNVYGFGYALGANFRNKKGQREFLFPADLDEILADGITKYGCRIR